MTTQLSDEPIVNRFADESDCEPMSIVDLALAFWGVPVLLAAVALSVLLALRWLGVL